MQQKCKVKCSEGACTPREGEALKGVWAACCSLQAHVHHLFMYRKWILVWRHVCSALSLGDQGLVSSRSYLAKHALTYVSADFTASAWEKP